jgi:hypothetical protein
MNTKRLLWLMLALLFCLGLIAYAPAAQATERADFGLGKWGPQHNGEIMVKVQRPHWGNLPVSVVVYDHNWQTIAGTEMTDGTYTFKGLRLGDYHIAAEADDGEISLTQDVPVFARQTTQVKMQLERPMVPAAAAAGYSAGRSCRGVAGDSRQIKVFATYGANIIYLQCGHVVGKVISSSCGCSSGSWRYTTDCQRSAPIYVNLPCPRR